MFKISVNAVVHTDPAVFTPKIVDVKDLRKCMPKEPPNFDEIISIPYETSWQIISKNPVYYKITESVPSSSESTELVSDVSFEL